MNRLFAAIESACLLAVLILCVIASPALMALHLWNVRREMRKPSPQSVTDR